MEVIIPARTLAAMVARASTAADSSDKNLGRSHVLLEAEGTSLAVVGTSETRSLRVTATAAVHKPGALLLPPKVLGLHLGETADVTITADGEAARVAIKRRKATVRGLPLQHAEEHRRAVQATPLRVEAAPLVMLLRTALSIATPDDTATSAGVQLIATGDRIEVYAIAPGAAAMVSAACEAKGVGKWAARLSRLSAEHLVKQLPADGAVRLAASDRGVTVSGDGWVWSGKLIEQRMADVGSFLDNRLREPRAATVTLNTADVRRVCSALAEIGAKADVRLHSGGAVISGATGADSLSEPLDGRGEGEATVLLGPPVLTPLLSVFGEMVTVGVTEGDPATATVSLEDATAGSTVRAVLATVRP